MNITSSSRFNAMRKYSVAMLFCALFASTLSAQKFQKTVTPMNTLNTVSTSNQFIWANVDGSSGLITVMLPPGRSAFDDQLSFQNKSFFTCSIGGTFFTNNEVIPLPANAKLLNDGVTTKIADTIRTIWSNKNQVDIIQDIYPVAFTKSAQIVYRWSFTNHSTSPITVACQYLEDIQITDVDAAQPSSSDGPTILTKWSYKPNWQFWPNPSANQTLPWFYIGFLRTLPATPSFDPGLSAMGYMDYAAPLNLVKPSRMSIGDWYTMASTIFGQGSWPWGSSYGAPPQVDNAVLIEFPGQGVGSGKTVTIGKTSYGTGEFEKCTGSLFSVDFYPEHVIWDSSKKVYSTNPIHIEKFVVNPDKFNTSANTKITLTVGDDMTLSDSLCNTKFGKTQTKPDTGLGMFLGPSGVGYFDWWACVNPVLFCTGAEDIDSLIFTATCGVCPPGFLNSQGFEECDQQITIDCAETDIDPPEFIDTLVKYNSASIAVRDWRTTDKGLKSITWTAEKGTDTTKIIVQSSSPSILPCFTDKVNHIVKVMQLDSTIGGCYDFTFTDCLGHQSFHTICMQAHTVDSLPPIVTITEAKNRSGEWSLVIHDNRPNDRGIDTIIVLSDTNIVPFVHSVKCVPNFSSTLLSLDTTKYSSICIRVIDCANNSHDTCISFKGKPDTTQSSAENSKIYHLALEANHPNPFSHITSFNYTVAGYGMVKLYLYDELGREMARIVDGVMAQGSHTIDFDGSKLPSGSYIVRLENGGGVVSRRVVVER